MFPPYAIREFDGIPVAFIGLTLKGTANIVSPVGIAGLEFRDEAETVNALVPELRARGVEAIVVLIHEGGLPAGGINDCPGISGPIVEIVKKFDKAVDLVISGHTHQAYVCEIDGRLVTSADKYGTLVTTIDLKLDPGDARYRGAHGRESHRAHDACQGSRPDRADRGLRQALRADRQQACRLDHRNAVARAECGRRKPARRCHCRRPARRDAQRKAPAAL